MLAHPLLRPLCRPLAVSLAVNPAGNFTPLSLSPAMWLDASDAATLYDASTGGALVAPDGAVGRWEDKSGNARHATQATLAARPLRKDAVLNGKSVLRFDGVDDGMAHTLGIVGDNTVFMVVRSYSVASEVQVAFAASAASSPLIVYVALDFTASGIWGTYRTDGFKPSGQTTRGGYKIISVTCVGVNGSFSHNGSVSSFTSTGNFMDTTDRRFVGNNPGNSLEKANCDIAEILVFPTALSTTDRAKVESYLNAKWAVY